MQSILQNYFRTLHDKRVVVLGLGVSNRPLVRLLLEAECCVVGCDKTPKEKLDDEVLELERLGCTLQVGEQYMENLRADVVFRTPGLHPDHPALVSLRQNGAEVTSEMEIFFELCPCKVIAVTGSDGKTTTTTLISEMLKASGKTVWLGGNIGTPLLPKVDEIQQEDIAVVELSSFQLMDMRKSPQIAVMTNLAPNHLDVHKDMQEYVDSKKNIFRFQKPGDILALNADNEITSSFAGNGSTRFFSRKKQLANGIDLRNGWICRDGIPVLKQEDILLPGVHNVENYMAAILAVDGLVEDETIRSVARNFGGVEHRIELVRIKDGVRYYNDSIASSPTRTIAGLNSFPQRVLLIAGGYDKNIPYDVLGEPICLHTKRVYLNGMTGPKIRKAVEAVNTTEKPELIDCNDFYDAVARAAAEAEPGDVVLMSPASAAFDQFKNFMERGKIFKKLIEEL